MSHRSTIIGIPTDTIALLGVARVLVERFRASRDAASLLAMVLATNHVMDWFLARDMKLRQNPGSVESLRRAYPQWNALRAIANGIKHPQSDAMPDLGPLRHTDLLGGLEWEDDEYWFGRYEGKVHDDWTKIDDLCAGFLDQFEVDLATGRARSMVANLNPAIGQPSDTD